MQFTLMNKNHKLIDFYYDENIKAITKIINKYDLNYLPLYLYNSSNLLKDLNDWLKSRFLINSTWFKQLSKTNYAVDLQTSIYTKSYGLSLSDPYWLKQKNKNIKWEDVNFFQNNFDYKNYLFLGLESREYNYDDVNVLYSPNITTGGELGKCWIIENNKRILYKSSNTFLKLEPLNEYIASKISEILGVSCVKYDLKVLSNLDKSTLVSSCETFCNENVELIPFYELGLHNKNYKECFEEYINLLNNQHILSAKEKVSKMLLLDLIISNHDRHLGNYGIIRDVNTLKWLDVAPIYDCGRAMLTYLPKIDLNIDNELIVFNTTNVSHKEVLNLIKDLKLDNDVLNKLKEIPNLYEEILNKYYKYTNINSKEDILVLKEKLKKNIMEVINFFQ